MSDNHYRLLAIYGRSLNDIDAKLDRLRLADEVGSKEWTQATRQFESLVCGLINLAGSAADKEKDADVPATATYAEA